MNSHPSDDLIPVEIKLNVGGVDVAGKGSVPPGRVRMADLLPIIQSLDDDIIRHKAEKLERDGTPISCRHGCAYCCRQLLPVSEAEALHLAEVVEAMEPSRRNEVKKRFHDLIRALDAAGLLERLVNWQALPDEKALEELALEYYGLYLDCPFLEDEACSIYADRPLRCREYLVVSPPENCKTPGKAPLLKVNTPLALARAVFRVGDGNPDRSHPVLPLVFALEWAEQASAAVPRYDGQELMSRFLTALSELCEPAKSDETDEA